MQRTRSNSIALSLLMVGILFSPSVRAETPSLIPFTGCIDMNGKSTALCAPPTCEKNAGEGTGVQCGQWPNCDSRCHSVPQSCSFNTGEFHAKCVPAYLAYAIRILFQLTGAIFLLMIILGGYQYVIGKAGGGGGEEGKARVRFAIIGFLVTALSFYIVDFILNSI